jgi:hypothetical protein
MELITWILLGPDPDYGCAWRPMPIILDTYLLSWSFSLDEKCIKNILVRVSCAWFTEAADDATAEANESRCQKIEIPARRHKNWNPVLTKEFSSWMHQSPKHMLSQKQSTMPSSTETIPSIPCSLADYTETIKIPSPSVFMLHIKPARHWAFRSQLRISLPKDATKLPIKESHNYASEASDE